jgi:hypothetical protein
MGDVERDGRIPDLGLHCIVETREDVQVGLSALS